MGVVATRGAQVLEGRGLLRRTHIAEERLLEVGDDLTRVASVDRPLRLPRTFASAREKNRR